MKIRIAIAMAVYHQVLLDNHGSPSPLVQAVAFAVLTASIAEALDGE
jgi:hypothetical protein